VETQGIGRKRNVEEEKSGERGKEGGSKDVILELFGSADAKRTRGGRIKRQQVF